MSTETSALTLLAAFPDLTPQERDSVVSQLSEEGRQVAEAIGRLQKHNGFNMGKASSVEKTAELYLRWAHEATETSGSHLKTGGTEDSD